MRVQKCWSVSQQRFIWEIRRVCERLSCCRWRWWWRAITRTLRMTMSYVRRASRRQQSTSLTRSTSATTQWPIATAEFWWNWTTGSRRFYSNWFHAFFWLCSPSCSSWWCIRRTVAEWHSSRRYRHHVLYYEVGKHNLLRIWDEVGHMYAFKSSTEYLNAVMYQVYKASSAMGE